MPDLFDRILLLKQSSIFCEVLTEDLRIVAQSLEQEVYLNGDRVFDINEQGDRMYLIESGKVGISIHADPKTRDFIAVMESGDCFGEMNILDDQPRSATAHILEDACLLSLHKEKLRGLVMSYPELSLGMMKSLSLRLRDTTALLNSESTR